MFISALCPYTTVHVTLHTCSNALNTSKRKAICQHFVVLYICVHATMIHVVSCRFGMEYVAAVPRVVDYAVSRVIVTFAVVINFSEQICNTVIACTMYMYMYALVCSKFYLVFFQPYERTCTC